MNLRVLLIVMCIAISMIPIGIIGGSQGFKDVTLYLIGLILFVTFIVSLGISYFISRPLERLTKNIDKISKGDLEVELENSEIYEINNLILSLNRVMTSLKLAIHKVGVKRGEIFEETMKAKAEVEGKYEQLLQTIDEWVWEADAKGVITRCSPRVATALGYTPEDVVGKPFFQFMSSPDVDQVQILLNETVKTHRPFCSYNLPYVDKQGYVVEVHTCAYPLFDSQGNLTGYWGVQKETNRQKRNGETSAETTKDTPTEIIISVHPSKHSSGKRKPAAKKTQRHASHEETDLDALVLFDEHAHIVDCTTAMHELLGYSRQELLALSFTDFDMLETPESLKEKLKEAKKHGSILVKSIHKRKNGSSLLVRQQIDYLQDKNLFQCMVKEEKP